MTNEYCVIGLFMEKNCRLVACIMGILKAGHAYLPIDVDYPEERVNYMINDSQAEYIINDTIQKNSELFSGKILNYESLIFDTTGFSSFEILNQDRTAYLMYTSGSTGKPKGVKVSIKNLNNFVHDFIKRLELTSRKKVLSLTSVSFDIFGLEMYCSLLSGSKLALSSKEVNLNLSNTTLY